jgi:ribosomal protein S27E
MSEENAEHRHPLTKEEIIEHGKLKWFSDAQREALRRKLAETIGEIKCEMCGSEIWDLAVAPVSPMVLDLDRTTETVSLNSHFSYPSAMINCRKCGNSKIFQLKLLGFDPFSNPEPELDLKRPVDSGAAA